MNENENKVYYPNIWFGSSMKDKNTCDLCLDKWKKLLFKIKSILYYKNEYNHICLWYNINSKFNVKTYQKWMSNFLNNVCNFYLVIYTNKESFYMVEYI